jgi:hypothetical protein
MASIACNPLKLRPLPRKSMAQLVARARNMGVPPEDYARKLVQDGLALQHEAESMSVAQIMAPVRGAAGAVNEREIVRLVAKARSDHHRIAARGKRR